MIYLASDHKGFDLKAKIKLWLTKWDYVFEDCGPFLFNSKDDYPDFVAKVGEKVALHPKQARGIVMGHTGQGEAMVANKFPGVRAAVFYGGDRGIIRLCREHNDANVLSLGASFIEDREAKLALKLWLETKFSGVARHKSRIQKIKRLES